MFFSLSITASYYSTFYISNFMEKYCFLLRSNREYMCIFARAETFPEQNEWKKLIPSSNGLHLQHLFKGSSLYFGRILLRSSFSASVSTFESSLSPSTFWSSLHSAGYPISPSASLCSTVCWSRRSSIRDYRFWCLSVCAAAQRNCWSCWPFGLQDRDP